VVLRVFSFSLVSYICMALIVRDPLGVPVLETEFDMRWQRGKFALLLTIKHGQAPQL
jgi:hypothetical protein